MENKEKKEGFDVSLLLDAIPKNKEYFAPKISKKLWDDAEIKVLGEIVKYLDKSKLKENSELKNIITKRLDTFEKDREEKAYKKASDLKTSEEEIEVDKIKKARDEINLSRLTSSKKLSDKTKSLLNSAFKKAMEEKSKRAEIVVNQLIEKKNETEEVSPSDKKKVDDMINVAIKSGELKKSDLGF
jgi:hypothetical protein